MCLTRKQFCCCQILIFNWISIRVWGTINSPTHGGHKATVEAFKSVSWEGQRANSLQFSGCLCLLGLFLEMSLTGLLLGSLWIHHHHFNSSQITRQLCWTTGNEEFGFDSTWTGFGNPWIAYVCSSHVWKVFMHIRRDISILLGSQLSGTVWHLHRLDEGSQFGQLWPLSLATLLVNWHHAQMGFAPQHPQVHGR